VSTDGKGDRGGAYEQLRRTVDGEHGTFATVDRSSDATPCTGCTLARENGLDEYECMTCGAKWTDGKIPPVRMVRSFDAPTGRLRDDDLDAARRFWPWLPADDVEAGAKVAEIVARESEQRSSEALPEMETIQCMGEGPEYALHTVQRERRSKASPEPCQHPPEKQYLDENDDVQCSTCDPPVEWSVEAWREDGRPCSRCHESIAWEGDPPESADDAMCNECVRDELSALRRERDAGRPDAPPEPPKAPSPLSDAGMFVERTKRGR